MRRFLTLCCAGLILALICPYSNGQSLEITLSQDNPGNRVLLVSFAPEGGNVVALQFDVQVNTQRLDAQGLQVTRGHALTSENGFDFRQVQPGRIRVVVYPPIRQQMPSLAAGQVAVLRIPGLEKLDLLNDDVRFVPGSIVLSDANAKTVKLRAAVSNISKEKGRRKN